MKNLSNYLLKGTLYIIIAILSILLLFYILVLVSINSLMTNLDEKETSISEFFYKYLKIIFKFFSLLVDGIPYIILKSGYKVNTRNSIYYLANSPDFESRELSNQLLIKNNLVLYLVNKIDTEEGLDMSSILRNINRTKEYGRLDIPTITKDYKKHPDEDRYFTLSALLFYIIVLNLTIINTNFKWIH